MASKNLLTQTKDKLTLSDDESLLDMAKIHHWLSVESYWAQGRDYDLMVRAIANSYPIGVYDGSTQIAFARLVSDAATFAWLCDVFVDTKYRGCGIGTWLAQASVEWAEENQVKRIILATKDAHDIYAKAGFEILKTPDRWMSIDNRPQAKNF